MAKKVTSYKHMGQLKYVMVTIPLPVSDGEKPEELTYMVRGLSVTEDNVRMDIMQSVEPPRPPVKKRMNLGGALDVKDLTQEEYMDDLDPTYLEQLKEYERLSLINVQRVLIYRFMCGVKGFDLTDDEIKEALGVDVAHPKDPLDSLIQRLDQIGEIILPEADQIHVGTLMNKVMELSGVDPETINFISSSSSLVN